MLILVYGSLRFRQILKNRIFFNKINDLRKYEISLSPHVFTKHQVLKTAHLSMMPFFHFLSTISLIF